MMPEVLGRGDRLKVRRVIVVDVVVDVVNVVAFGHCVDPVGVHPHFLVEASDSAHLVRDSRREIASVSRVLSVGVPTESDAFEYDEFDFSHTTSLSAYPKESNAWKDSLAKNGWSAVARTFRPFSVTSSRVFFTPVCPAHSTGR